MRLYFIKCYMSDTQIQYMSKSKIEQLKEEMRILKDEKIPALAKRIDDARQMGDLSENAEYHAAREDLSWAYGRVQEIEFILQNSQLINDDHQNNGKVQIGSQVTVKVNGNKKDFFIVGAQEAEPLKGRISNESPLGKSFLGHKKGDKVEVRIPSGIQLYEIVEVK